MKVLPLAELKDRVRAAHAAGRTIALANGLFDLLHVGHLRYLEGAKAEADLLVVAINADVSARALKGEGRPVVPEGERAELVAGFSCVDFVTLFADRTVEPLLRALRPDVHCKGTDYTADTVPEREVARELGIRVAIVGDPKDHATSDLLGKLRGRR
ncbi:MAG TPA: adenylyltransferase/cytidyltransferase family protein [Candidatus Polarisedimenticolaceae bacterium]|nr:adenylyltransferase/cytidyltransferase family protein [Candidatus Polarisedimenticolaceae bacterium]